MSKKLHRQLVRRLKQVLSVHGLRVGHLHTPYERAVVTIQNVGQALEILEEIEVV